MFSVQQKRNIANQVQQILRDTGHPELPIVGEINFTLHVEGRVNWSWADIQNNAAVPIPSLNSHNEAQAQKCVSAEPQHGRKPDKVKSLAQYLGEYLTQDMFTYTKYDERHMGIRPDALKRIIEQALNAYESTEQVKIRIEKDVR